MSHYITLPLSSNGVIDPAQRVDSIIAASLSASFGTNDVFLYSHGWWTSAEAALNEYNIATTGYRYLVGRTPAGPNQHPPINPLLIGIHWPSTIEDAPSAISNFFEPLTFYQMEKRADDIGEEGVYALLRMILTNIPKNRPTRIALLGHSFGCKVICAAIQKLAEAKVALNAEVSFSIVLLEAAFRTDALDPGESYGSMLPYLGSQVRMLVTHSDEDLALNKAFPAARTINFFAPGVKTALGATGPGNSLATALGGVTNVALHWGDNFLARSPINTACQRLVVANLTPFHQSPNNTYGQADHHSDIFADEVYSLMAWFLVQ